MLYITQLVFVHEGKEELFREFEDQVLPLMPKYGGKLLYRIRPNLESVLVDTGEQPYEIHVISFESEDGLQQYSRDDTRSKFLHLKEASVKSQLILKGSKV